MSEQLKQELEADTDRLEAETVAGSETIEEQEKDAVEGKLESQEGDESKEEVEAAGAENAKPVKQKAREKLEAEKKKATQKNFADPVITYLMKRCEEDQGLAEDVMQEGKTWNKCFSYIVEQARKQSNGRSTTVEDRVVYEWAEDYYHKDDKAEEDKKAKEAAEKKKKEKERKEKATTSKENKARADYDVARKSPTDNHKLSEAEIAAMDRKETPKPKPKKNSKDMDGQLDIFSLLGM